LKNASTPSSQSKPLEFSENVPYAAAKKKLDELTAQLAETGHRKESQKNLRGRLSDNVAQWLAKSPPSLPNMTSDELDGIARRVIISGGVPTTLMEILREKALKVHFADSGDMDHVEEIMRTDASWQLLKRAVEIQALEVGKQRKIAMAEVSSSVRFARDKVARNIAAIVGQLILALTEERDFIERLRAQDPFLPDLLSPRPFPIDALADPRMLEWLELSGRDTRALIAAAPVETTKTQGATGR
jgi:hypothetical protein